MYGACTLYLLCLMLGTQRTKVIGKVNELACWFVDW